MQRLAAEAGFDRVVFVIKHEIEEDFKKITDGRFDGKIEVAGYSKVYN